MPVGPDIIAARRERSASERGKYERKQGSIQTRPEAIRCLEQDCAEHPEAAPEATRLHSLQETPDGNDATTSLLAPATRNRCRSSSEPSVKPQARHWRTFAPTY